MSCTLSYSSILIPHRIYLSGHNASQILRERKEFHLRYTNKTLAVTTRSQPCFGPKDALTVLKRAPPCRYNVLVVSYEIVGPNKQTFLTGPNKPPHRGRRSALIPFVTIRSQSCRYYSLCTQRGHHGFKTRLLGLEEPLHI